MGFPYSMGLSLAALLHCLNLISDITPSQVNTLEQIINLASVWESRWNLGGIHFCSQFRSFLVACYATLQPALSVRPSIRPPVSPSVPLYIFLGFCDFRLHCSCPNDWVTSITAPTHPHATGVAVYPALLKRTE